MDEYCYKFVRTLTIEKIMACVALSEPPPRIVEKSCRVFVFKDYVKFIDDNLRPFTVFPVLSNTIEHRVRDNKLMIYVIINVALFDNFFS